MGIADRKAREKEARRKLIMDEADKLFHLKSFDGTTMEDIANKVELSPSTIYLYFKNKEELYATINLKKIGILLEKINHIDVDKNSSANDKAIELKRLLYSYYEFDQDLLLDVFHFQTSDLLKQLSPKIVDELKSFAGNAVKAISNIFNSGINSKEFREMNTTAIADIIWSLFSGLVIWEESKTALDAKKRYLKTTLDLAFDVILQGVKK